jgi:hypothetical protein
MVNPRLYLKLSVAYSPRSPYASTPTIPVPELARGFQEDFRLPSPKQGEKLGVWYTLLAAGWAKTMLFKMDWV